MESELLGLFLQNQNIGYGECELVTDRNGKVVDVLFLDINPVMERLTFFKRGEVAGRSLKIMPGFHEEWISKLAAAREAKIPCNFSMELKSQGRRLDATLLFIDEKRLAVIFSENQRQLENIQRELKNSYDYMDKIFDNAQIAISILVEADGEFVYTYINQTHTETFGFEKGFVLGKTSPKLYGRKTGALMHALQKKSYISGETVKSDFDVKTRSRTVSGQGIIIPYFREERCVGVLSMFIDVTSLRKTQQELEIALRGMKFDVWRYNVKKQVISFRVSQAFAETELTLRQYNEGYVHREDRQILSDSLTDYIAGNAADLHCEYRIKDGMGSYRWIKTIGFAVTFENKIPLELVGINTDITESKTMTNRLRIMLNYDPLTGLVNRKRLMEIMTEAIRTGQDSFCAAGVFLDMDNFKSINDSLGHAAGDEFLKAAAKSIVSNIPPGSTVSRLSGDEFFVFIQNCADKQVVFRAAQNMIRSVTGTAVRKKDRGNTVSASAGICFYPDDAKTAEEMLTCADIAMFEAKKEGKNRYAVYDPQKNREHIRSVRLVGDLDRAVQEDEFEILYQPVVCAAGNHLAGLEALLRWNHPDYGLLIPDEFMETAEISGMIVNIEHKMFKSIVRQMKIWEETGFDYKEVSVNLSPISLNRFHFAASVVNLFELTGISCEKLCFEITKEIFLNETDVIRENLDRLNQAGFSIIIDDFDCDLRLLRILERIRFSGVKTDSGLFGEGEGKLACEYLFRMIGGLFERLGRACVIKGLESKSQFDALRKMGFTLFQGRYFSPPKTASEISALPMNQKNRAVFPKTSGMNRTGALKFTSDEPEASCKE